MKHLRSFLQRHFMGSGSAAYAAIALLFIQSPVQATPQVDGCSVFPADNIWNTTIDTLPVDPNSAAYVATIGAVENVHPDFGSGLWNGAPIGIPFTTVAETQAEVDITFDYADESDPGPYPIPPDARIEGGEHSNGDRHVLVLERDNCILYELFSAYPQGDGSWHAGSGAVFDLKDHALRPAGWTSADAAGLPILPGLMRYDEVASGEIRHALRFTAPQTRRAYIWPARHYASSLTNSIYPPMGQRFRLKADYDISGFSSAVQVILRALKQYGMILADNGSPWFLSGVPDERWDNDILRELRQVTGAAFEAVDESGLMLDPDSGQIAETGVVVDTVNELVSAVDEANAGGVATILLADGTYDLTDMLPIWAAGITVRSQSGNRDAVILRGQGMHGAVTHIFNVAGNGFSARDMTLRDVSQHAVQLQIDVDDVSLRNLHILDTGEQMVKVAYSPSDPRSSDNGRLEYSRLEYSAGIGPQWYIGGIDAHFARNWTVRNNTFVGIRSPSGDVAEHAIHFWSDSENTLVEGNTIVNCDRGIGFGLGGRGHSGGIIRNNMIYHDTSEGFADVGIGLESAAGAQVYNNTILFGHSYPNAIEYRFSGTTGVLIANNLTNRAIAQRDGSSATLEYNLTGALPEWFVDPPAGDLHLAAAYSSVVDQGTAVIGLSDDFDGEARPQGAGIDIGADEFTQAAPDRATLIAPFGRIPDTRPTYRWWAAIESHRYQLWISDADGEVFSRWYRADDVCVDVPCTVTPDTVLEPGAYTWWVQTDLSNGPGPWSDGMSFYVGGAPGKTTLVSPNGTITDTTPTYIWNADGAATSYKLVVKDASGFSISTWYTATAAGCPGGTGTCSVTPATAVNGSGTWWIKTWNAAGDGPWSSGMSFNVGTPPGKVTLVSPSGTITDTTPIYIWNADSAATSYKLVVKDAGVFSISTWYTATAAGCSGGTGTCSVTPATTVNGSGTWWIKTWNAAGDGPWSNGMSFLVTP